MGGWEKISFTDADSPIQSNCSTSLRKVPVRKLFAPVTRAFSAPLMIATLQPVFGFRVCPSMVQSLPHCLRNVSWAFWSAKVMLPFCPRVSTAGPGRQYFGPSGDDSQRPCRAHIVCHFVSGRVTVHFIHSTLSRSESLAYQPFLFT